jgi:MFS family permease
MYAVDRSGIKFGPFWISPGLTGLNIAAITFGSFTTVAMIVFMSLIQPYVLNEVVHIPAGQQGQITGYLTAMQEVIVVLLVGLAGAWSDRVGRRLVYVIGFCVMAAGYLVYPLASSPSELFLFRIVFAIGIVFVPVMLSATVQDTPQEISRGRWIGFMNICQGLGVLLLATALLGNGPEWFASRGFSPRMAGQLSLWSATALCGIAAVVLWFGLPADMGKTQKQQNETVMHKFRAGVREGFHNPRLAIAFGAAFIGRGDLVIVGNFLTLRITQHGIDQGLTTAEASGKAFMMFGIVQIAALSWAFFMGLITDRSNRMTALCIALVLATVGYTLIGWAEDPMAGSFIPLAILLGIGEVSVIVTGGALLGQEAKASMRGAVVGVFNTMGGIGIIIASGLGGIIYDAIGRAAPFTMMGIFNGLLLLMAIVVRIRAGAPATSPKANSNHESHQ